MSGNKTVLVISDGQGQFALAASLLRNEGYSVIFENDVTRGLMLAKAEPPQLIISELAVPNVDGLQLCCRVRGDRALESTPILLVGDLSKGSPIVADGLRCGAADYLQKPIDQFKLFDLCRDVAGPAKNKEISTLSFECWEIDNGMIHNNALRPPVAHLYLEDSEN